MPTLLPLGTTTPCYYIYPVKLSLASMGWRHKQPSPLLAPLLINPRGCLFSFYPGLRKMFQRKPGSTQRRG